MSDEFLARRCRVLGVRYTSDSSDVKFTSDHNVSVARDCAIIDRKDGKPIDKLIDGDILNFDDIDFCIYYGGRVYPTYRLRFPEFPPKFFKGVFDTIDIDVSKLDIGSMIIKMDVPSINDRMRYTHMPRYFAYGTFVYNNHQFTICFKSLEFPFLTADDIMRLVKDNNLCKYYWEEDNEERTITCNIRSERYCDAKLDIIHNSILCVFIDYIDGDRKTYSAYIA